MADLIPVVQRLDALQARVDALESFAAQTMTSDVTLVDGVDTFVLNVPLALGSHLGVATLSLELVEGGIGFAVTAWLAASGPVTLTGNRSAQVTLHPQLPYDSITLGPVRADVTGVANVVVYVRANSMGGGTGRVVVKAATSTTPTLAGASGFLAR